MVKAGKKTIAKKRSKRVLKPKKDMNEKRRKHSSEARPAGQHKIPAGYNIDTVVLMPVNTDTSFIYWEITDRLLRGNLRKLKSGPEQLMMKVYDAGELEEICSFEVKERIGNSYIHYQSSYTPLYAEIGIANGKRFVGLLKSRTVSSPSSSPAKREDQTSMKRSSAAPAGTRQEIWMTMRGDRSMIVPGPSRGRVLMNSDIMEYYRKISGSHDSSPFSKT
jgi:hypothetical protein